jgi:hypothetical protein
MTTAPTVDLELGRKNRGLRFDLKATQRLERETALKFGPLIASLRAGDLENTVTALWLGLLHAEPNLSRGRVESLLEADLEAERLTFKIVIERIFEALTKSPVLKGVIVEADDGAGGDEGDAAKKSPGSTTGSESPNHSPMVSSD